MVKNQVVYISYLIDTNKFDKAQYIEEVISTKDGYVQEINAENIGKIACGLGAGRIRKEDIIDYSVGLKLCKKVSEKVTKGETLGIVYANDMKKLEIAKKQLLDTVVICDKEVQRFPTIFGICK